jgi:hypothetical protein
LYTKLIAAVPEFWGHSDNEALRLAILFLETRRNHKGPNLVGGDNSHFVSCQKLLHQLSSHGSTIIPDISGRLGLSDISK